VGVTTSVPGQQRSFFAVNLERCRSRP